MGREEGERERSPRGSRELAWRRVPESSPWRRATVVRRAWYAPADRASTAPTLRAAWQASARPPTDGGRWEADVDHRRGPGDTPTAAVAHRVPTGPRQGPKRHFGPAGYGRCDGTWSAAGAKGTMNAPSGPRDAMHRPGQPLATLWGGHRARWLSEALLMVIAADAFVGDTADRSMDGTSWHPSYCAPCARRTAAMLPGNERTEQRLAEGTARGPRRARTWAAEVRPGPSRSGARPPSKASRDSPERRLTGCLGTSSVSRTR